MKTNKNWTPFVPKIETLPLTESEKNRALEAKLPVQAFAIGYEQVALRVEGLREEFLKYVEKKNRGFGEDKFVKMVERKLSLDYVFVSMYSKEQFFFGVLEFLKKAEKFTKTTNWVREISGFISKGFCDEVCEKVEAFEEEMEKVL